MKRNREEKKKERSPSHAPHHISSRHLAISISPPLRRSLKPPHLRPRPRQVHADPPHHEPVPCLSYRLSPRIQLRHGFLLNHSSHRDAERRKGDGEEGTVQLLLLLGSLGEDVGAGAALWSFFIARYLDGVRKRRKLGRDGRRPSKKAMLLMMMLMRMMRVTLSDRRGARSKAKEKKREGRRPRKHQTTLHTA
jgi:hypothetical protein